MGRHVYPWVTRWVTRLADMWGLIVRHDQNPCNFQPSPTQQSKSNTHHTKPLTLGVCDRVSRPSQYPVSPRPRRNPSALLSLSLSLLSAHASRCSPLPSLSRQQNGGADPPRRCSTEPPLRCAATRCRPQRPRRRRPQLIAGLDAAVPKDPAPPSPTPCRRPRTPSRRLPSSPQAAASPRRLRLHAVLDAVVPSRSAASPCRPLLPAG